MVVVVVAVAVAVVVVVVVGAAGDRRCVRVGVGTQAETKVWVVVCSVLVRVPRGEEEPKTPITSRSSAECVLGTDDLLGVQENCVAASWQRSCRDTMIGAMDRETSPFMYAVVFPRSPEPGPCPLLHWPRDGAHPLS